MPLLGASGAQAADLDTWDRVAQCESGGLWSADTGNGYYGGLQLTQETWEQYGGTAYAERPDLASRSQQIAVAEKILADQGPYAWPSCGINAGLRHDTTGEAPAIDPDLLLPVEGEEGDAPGGGGEGGADGPGEAPGRGDTSGTGAAEGTGGAESEKGAGADGTDRAPRTDTDADTEAGADADSDAGTDTGAGTGTDTDTDTEAGAEADVDADAREGTGRHRGERDPRELELERQKAVEGREDDRRATGDERPVDEDDRIDRSARAEFAGGLEPGGSGAPAPTTHLVRPGDSLALIAEEHEVRGGWIELYENNREVVGEDPDLILPGQELGLG
ncbi:transglycosylase family protein [Streptomyces taklimakanensis]|nr:transglycosylase family protein [Streptomyces taklimakanensis]